MQAVVGMWKDRKDLPDSTAYVRRLRMGNRLKMEDCVLKSILIDSDILIEVSSGRDKAILSRWDQLGKGETALLFSPVTVAELWRGARPQEYSILNALFVAVHCTPIDIPIGQRAGDDLRQYVKNRHVELGDAYVAATVSIQIWNSGPAIEHIPP
jgi:predicted nucleic acid-binding protein